MKVRRIRQTGLVEALLAFLLILIIPNFFFAASAGFDKNQKHLIVLHSYHQGMLWVDSVNKGINSEFSFDPDLVLHFEYMDSKRFHEKAQIENFKNLINYKYSDMNLKAIITVDDNAFLFAQKHREKLFNNASVIFCGLNFYSKERFAEYSDFTGVVERNDYLKSIQVALKLHPTTKKVFVINDDTTTGRANRETLESLLDEIDPDIVVEFCDFLPINELKKQIEQLSLDTLILLLSYNVDSKGKYIPYRELSSLVKEAAKVPVYSVWDFFFDGCAVGGSITRGFDQGAVAARLAKRVLNGEKAEDIEVITSFVTRYVFDYEKLQQYKVDTADLPADSIVLNRPYSLYRENPALFAKLAGVIIIFILLVGGLVLSRFKLLSSQKQLFEKQESLKITLNSIAEAVIATDNQGRITHMNPVAEVLSGCTSEDALGKKLSEVVRVTDSDNNVPEEPIEKMALEKTEKLDLGSFNKLINPQGKTLRISISVSPIKNESKNVSGVVAVFRDLTEEMLIQEKLKQSQKMDAIGQLAGGVAHDFNNALSGIIGATQLLEREIQGEFANKILKMIEKSADRAADLTAKLLAFSRKSSLDIASQDFHAVIQTSIDILSRTIDKKITLVKKLEAQETVVCGNFSELESVILNLGINASHAMPDGGTISFYTKNEVLDQKYCETSNFVLTPGKYILLEVKDTGCGIPPENLGKIFDPFFTTKEPGKGTGLGLSASYGNILHHKGAITVYSEPDRGSVFRIYLPVYKGNVVEACRIDMNYTGTGTILLVDDEPAIRFTNRLILEEAGYKVMLAKNGLEALDIYKENSNRIDLVILDMIMPEMNGNECFFKLIKEFPEAKVILCSGFLQDADIYEMKSAGLKAFICKPCKSSELLRAVGSVLEV